MDTFRSGLQTMYFLIDKKINVQFKSKFEIQNLKTPKKMIMNEFMGRMQKEMIQLRKKNMNLINEFKIEMFQGRKKIEKNIIKLEFGITQSQLMNENIGKDNISIIKKKVGNKLNDNNLSTNYNSRAIEPQLNDGCHISGFTSNLNKENEDPNRRVKTDISVIEQFPVKHCHQNVYDIQNDFNLNALKNDESIEINTEQVRKKYQKFISPSAGWTLSADPLRQMPQHKGSNGQQHPFCTEFVHEGEDNNSEENYSNRNQSNRKDYDIFGFKDIDERNFSRTNTIQELEQFEENNDSRNY